MSRNLNRALIAAAAGLCGFFAVGSVSAQPSDGTGACCVRSSAGVTCTVVTGMACRQARGLFRGPGTVCDPNPCVPPPPPPPPPSGACCVRTADGAVACRVGPAPACFEAGGRFRGPDTVCDPNPCVPPPVPSGACCVRGDDGAIACRVGPATACREAGGRFRGPDTVCDPNPCVPPPPPSGACCSFGDDGAGVCAVTTLPDCRTAGGRFRGPDTVCDPNPCPAAPPARGACCLAATDTVGPRCFIVTQARCTTAGGAYGGDNSTCRSANCPTTCACDYDHDGFLTVRDLFAFTDAYLAGSADFNGDGVTDESDLTEFMTCFRSAPDGCVRRRR